MAAEWRISVFLLLGLSFSVKKAIMSALWNFCGIFARTYLQFKRQVIDF